MEPSRINLTREQTVAVAILTVVVSVGVVWLMVSIVGNDTPPTSTTTTSAPPTETTSTVPTTTTTTTEPTTTVGVFDEVAAVEEFIEAFAGAIESGDSAFLFERLHPAVKATHEEDACRQYIDDRVLALEGYRQEGPIVGPIDSEFGEFPVTSYEVLVTFEFEGDPTEETAMFSLTEGVVRWFAECS